MLIVLLLTIHNLPVHELKYYTMVGNIHKICTWSWSNLPFRTSVLTAGCLFLFLFCSYCPVHNCICFPLFCFSLLLSFQWLCDYMIAFKRPLCSCFYLLVLVLFFFDLILSIFIHPDMILWLRCVFVPYKILSNMNRNKHTCWC